jgi:hypothetical protein
MQYQRVTYERCDLKLKLLMMPIYSVAMVLLLVELMVLPNAPKERYIESCAVAEAGHCGEVSVIQEAANN